MGRALLLAAVTFPTLGMRKAANQARLEIALMTPPTNSLSINDKVSFSTRVDVVPAKLLKIIDFSAGISVNLVEVPFHSDELWMCDLLR